MEDDGFDGFKVRCELLKSRTNKAGQFCHMAYNQLTGFDPIYTQYEFAHEHGLLEGRNPYKYFAGHKENKFDSRKFREMFMADEKLRYAMFNSTIPILEKQLARVDPEDTAMALSHMEVLERLEQSQTTNEFKPEA